MANVSSSNGLEKRPKLRFPGFDEPYKQCRIGDIYRNFTALMSRQVLNRFRVYGRMNQIRNVCMPQLVRRHFKI